MESSTSDRNRWIKSLKVGDVVCDCRYRHLKIVDLTEERWPPTFIEKAICHIPNEKIINFLYWMCDVLRISILFDKTLTLEDGNSCSAVYCCEPVDHDVSSHS